MPQFRPIEDIPAKYRCVFEEYPCFNIVQSEVLDDALSTDNSLVISAPTGSGKTAIFEMAIIRHLILNERDNNDEVNNRIVYISPMKALCQERLVDWHKKFADFNVRCVSLTSDSPDDIDIKTIAQYNLLIATPEKWDVLTRRWRDNIQLMTTITLFLIDEVHLLNADTRGSTLEVIVSRMKTAMNALTAYKTKWNIRFVALSATIPNVEDIAEWIGPTSVKHYKFSEEVRPVKLEKIVLGFAFHPQTQSIFKFDMSLNYRLPSLISKYSEGKPTLIFCNTRKSVEMTASHLVQNLQIHLTQDQKEDLMRISRQLSDVKLRQQIVHGIAFHHAGLVHENRYLIEESFRKAHIPVLVTTSTLAMGVNLPAHLVIVKSTKCYCDSGYKDYDEVSIFQMIGRAGRSQFDVSATALILTSLQDKVKYEKMLGCSQTIESNLHKHLTEHLNAEVVLKTITDLDVAMRWLSSTFLYVRAIRAPEKYKLPSGQTREKIDKILLEMCQLDLNKLVKAGMIQISEDIEITPTVVGEIMAKYYVAFETMKLFTQISGSEILVQIIGIISKSKEFSEIYLRQNDKKCLNTLNKCSKKECVRYPLTGRIKTSDMKVNVIIQAILGNLDIYDQSVLCDSIKIIRSCERLANCLIEYLETRDKCYSALLNTTILLKCFRVKLWENSPYVSKQLTGVGQVMSKSLMKAGKTTLKAIATTNPRHIEMIISRKAPFGNTLVDEARHLPNYSMTLKKCGNFAELCIILENPSEIEEKSTISLDSKMTLLVGDSENDILLYEKYTHSYMMDTPAVRKEIPLENQNLEFVKANFISENYVGIDCYSYCNLESTDAQNQSTSAKTPNQTKAKNPKQNKKTQQTFLNSYMQCVKRDDAFTEAASNNKNKSATVKFVGNQENKQKNSLEPETTSGTKKKFNFKNNKEYAPENDKKQFEIVAKPDEDSKSSNNSLKTNKNNDLVPKAPSNETEPFEKSDSFISESFANAIFDELEADKLSMEGDGEANFDEESANALLDKLEADKLVMEGKEGTNFNEDSSKFGTGCPKSTVPVEKVVPFQTNRDINHSFNGNEKIIDQDLSQNMLYRRLAKKFGQNIVKDQEQENLSKLNIPETIADRNMPQSISIYSPHRKRLRKHEESKSTFDVFPQKNIKWRSPLVNSPAIKYSPHGYDFTKPDIGKENVENNDFRYGAHNASISSLASSFASERFNTNSTKPVRKTSKFQLPLSDHDCMEEVNDSFTRKGNAFDEFVDLEHYGIVNRQKDVITQASHAGKYYSQLMNSEQQKYRVKEEPAAKIISSTSQTKAARSEEEYQQSQEIFSDNDILPTNTRQLSKSPVDSIIPNAQREYQQNNLPSFTQPIPIEYQHHPSTNTVRNDVEVEYYSPRKPETDRLNRSFIEPPNVEDFHQQRPLFNPYLEQRYAPRVSSYFSQQPPPCFSAPNPYPHHVCCNHYPRMNPYFKPYPEVNPYRDYVENRPLHNPRPYTTSINDIPDAYIDHFSQQLDEPSFFNPTRNVSRYDASFNREPTSLPYKENIPQRHSQSYARSLNDLQPEQLSENRLPAQIPPERIGKIFAPSAKRKFSHDHEAQSESQQSRFLSAPPSVQRRSRSFENFEERLDYMVSPRPIPASRNQNIFGRVQDVEYSSSKPRQFLANRFK